MNKLILGAAIFSLSMLANANGADVTVTTTKEVADTADVNITADKSSIAIGKTDCIKETGTRIKRSKDKNGCNGLPGTSYEREDIDRTGAISAGEALERLDPSIQIRR
jgi:hypothetical protein